MPIDILGFIALSVVVIATPGQDTALTIRNTLAGGRRAGIGTAVGVALGQLGWTVAASFGLTALLIASEPLFNLVKLLGAAYLMFLGAQALRAAVGGAGPDSATEPSTAAAPRGLLPVVAARQGLISNLSNAKMAVFFTSLLPQFVPEGPGALAAMLGLGTIFATMTLSWLTLYAFVVARASAFLARTAVRRALDAVLGTVLVALGVRVALSER